MGIPTEPRPVKLFAALLFSEAEILSPVEGDLQSLFGPVDLASETVPWQTTDYYEKEMGRGLARRFVSFGPLLSPEALPDAKLASRTIEERHRRIGGGAGGRRINIDPGYLDIGKVVLASTKGAGHRLYLRSGIYAEMTLGYRNGSFHPFATTYPDYLWPVSIAFFRGLRRRYLEQLKQLKQPGY